MADPSISGPMNVNQFVSMSPQEAFRAQRKRMRQAQNVVDVEDIPQEEWNKLVLRNAEIRQSQEATQQVFNKFSGISIPGTDERLAYAVHSGSPELAGGLLEPSRTKGFETTLSSKTALASDTKSVNRVVTQNARAHLKKLEYSEGLTRSSSTALENARSAKEEFIKTGTITRRKAFPFDENSS